jgi:ATP-dependent DNA ligase
MISPPPQGALHLSQLGIPFVIDGEQLQGDFAGSYVAFDLLEWNNRPLIATSYAERINTLQHAMLQAGLLLENRSTPTFEQARANSTIDQLALLVAVTGAEQAMGVFAEVQASAGEGVILRLLSGDYQIRPFKYLLDIDAFVISINSGQVEGSLKCGVIRPSDGAIIEIANVRSGLSDSHIRTVRSLLQRGERPVFTITYLPARTPGIQLVEPKTSMTARRTDKSARECTTDQFGEEKASFIEQAIPAGEVAIF